MFLDKFINEFYKTPEAQECCRLLRKYTAECDSFIEYGSRGGVTAIAILQGLVDKKRKFKPRLIGVDLIHDDSILRISEIAERIGVSYQFWKGHTKDFPIFECDGFLWDTFHCAGNLLQDLNAVSPFVNKFITIVGTLVDGEVSEAVRRNLDTEMVANELRIDSEGVKGGLKSAISEFLKNNTSWKKELEFGDITVLKRIVPKTDPIFIG